MNKVTSVPDDRLRNSTVEVFFLYRAADGRQMANGCEIRIWPVVAAYRCSL